MSEKKIYQILEMSLWVLNPLLLVLAVYNQVIQPGLFFQWIGKLHPLVLHFPIVFGIVIAIYLLFFQNQRVPVEIEKLILVINAVFASGVVICGLLLSKQNGYDDDLINLHKWGGILIALLSWLSIYLLDLKVQLKRYFAIIFGLVLIFSTHKGAQLTHGVNALSFPEQPEASVASNGGALKEETVYKSLVAPIFAQKCVSCHGPDKMKADLRLDTPEYILKGSKDGSIIKGENNNIATLIEVIHFPLANDMHMPPDGKMQLTAREISILNNWIKGGANFTIKGSELTKDDSLKLFVSKAEAVSTTKFEFKNNLPDLEEFNSNYCTTNYLFNGSDEVEVNFFQGAFYNSENLKKLEKIKDGIISLNLSGMPLKKEDLDIIIQFKNLQIVNLNNTNLEIGALEVLKTLPKLKAVSICGIEFEDSSLEKFLDNAKFTELNIWTAKGTQKSFEKLMAKYPSVKITVGDNMQDHVMKISNPSIEQDSLIIPSHVDVKLKHLLKGVVIKYTTDGTDPDSLKSMEYKEPFRLFDNTVLKIKAYRSGWQSSDIVSRTYYRSEIHPDSILLLTQPDPKHKGNGAKTLIDYDLGETNKYTDKWLGYQNSTLDFLIGFNELKTLHSVYLNAFIEFGAEIFPIAAITAQGSNDGKLFKKIAETTFPMPKKDDPSLIAKIFTCKFPEGTTYKYYKFSVSNVKKMPAWRKDRKGKPAWIFIDELFLN